MTSKNNQNHCFLLLTMAVYKNTLQWFKQQPLHCIQRTLINGKPNHLQIVDESEIYIKNNKNIGNIKNNKNV